MGEALTIQNLDEEVTQKLRVRAATHQRSIEAEAREILVRAVTEEPVPVTANSGTPEEKMKRAIELVRGIWKDRISTDDLMAMTRGDAIDDAYSRR